MKKNSASSAILISFGVAAILAIPVTVFSLLFRAYVIPTGSMEQTLLIGDRLIAKVKDIRPISRGEIVIYQFPIDPRQANIKRVSAIPGDHLKIVNKQLYLNGAPVQSRMCDTLQLT